MLFSDGDLASMLDHIQTPIVWLKDGQPAQNRPRIRIHGSKSEKLEVLSVFKEDSGIYQCFVNQGPIQIQASGELRLGGETQIRNKPPNHPNHEVCGWYKFKQSLESTLSLALI